MKQYLLDTFRYNDWANRQIMAKISELPEPAGALRLLSHLVTSQEKWLARITYDPRETQMAWFETPFALAELETHWVASLQRWLAYLASLAEDELDTVIHYTATSDGNRYSSLIRDIALQLNYHSIQHRAQIMLLMRQQSIAPPFIEYIGYTSARE